VSRFSFLGTCLYPPHLRRTGSIARGWIWIKIVLNYLTPFLVANLGLLSKRREQGGPKKQREPT